MLNRVDDLGAAFAVPLGLLALIYVASTMAVIGVQVNVVIRKRLWPRALLTPFTDAVELTDADQRAYASYAKAQRHKGFETVSVTFDKHTQTPGDPAVTPTEVAPVPTRSRRRRSPLRPRSRAANRPSRLPGQGERRVRDARRAPGRAVAAALVDGSGAVASWWRWSCWPPCAPPCAEAAGVGSERCGRMAAVHAVERPLRRPA